MVIDTSAVLAILPGEAEAEQFAKAIADDHKRLISAFSARAGNRNCDRNEEGAGRRTGMGCSITPGVY